jgi:hypothetical protein
VLRFLRPRVAFQAAIEAAVIGLLLGLVDVHSTNQDGFNSHVAYLTAATVLGLRYAARAWQAWVPLSSSLYLVHLAAIGWGYQPPYVEEDANFAGGTLIMVFPVSFGLAVGACIHSVVSRLARASGHRLGGADPDRASSRYPALPLTKPPKRRRLTVGGLMGLIAVLCIHLAFVRTLLRNDPFFGYGTIYSEQFSEIRFSQVRVGMTPGEVEAIMGRPLEKVAWNLDTWPRDEEIWFYTNQHIYTANYHRRWVCFKKRTVVQVVSDFWID